MGEADGLAAPPAPWRIRPLVAADLDALDHLQRAGLPDPFTRADLAAELARPMTVAFGAVLGAAHGERLVGAILAWLVVDELQVLQVVVAAAARGRGVGRHLVATLLAAGAARGAVVATLEVRASNVAALRLYQGGGFVADGLRRRYYPDGEDAVLLSAALPPVAASAIDGDGVAAAPAALTTPPPLQEP